MANTKISKREPVISDDNYLSVVEDPTIDGETLGRGRIPRDFERFGYGSQPYMLKLRDTDLIPEHEWEARMEELAKAKVNLSYMMKEKHRIPTLHQSRTNYCWINSPVWCMLVFRAFQNLPYIPLSPASGGALIKDYRNIGGFGPEAVKFLVEVGVAPTSLWPANAIDPRYDTAQSRKIRKEFRFHEWIDLTPKHVDPDRAWREMVTLLLSLIPVSVGYDWWAHQVTGMDLVKTVDGWGIRIANSWGTGWGDNGYGILLKNRAIPDDAIAPKVATASPGTPQSLKELLAQAV